MVGDFPVTERAEEERSIDQSIDVIFDALSDRHRRHVLRSLLEHGQEIAISDLAEDLAGRDAGAPRPEVPPQASQNRMEGGDDGVQKVTASLYHVHIPKLVDAGVVKYDPDRGIVRPTESTRQVEHVLALAEPLSSE